MLDHKKLAVIHITKKELGLSDQNYRNTLEKITGVRSAKNLDDRSFHKLMNYFARSKYYRINQDGLTFRQKMFIKNLKEQLGWNELHFGNFLKKYYKKTSIEILTKKEARNVIESLKNILKHENEKRQGQRP
ncbi:MAG: DUF1018 domain-containing protein [Deltaproteobacteria bacterium]|nr:DUF1018 domain-containing protein [Deltaproteobacteria bacterium]